MSTTTSNDGTWIKSLCIALSKTDEGKRFLINLVQDVENGVLPKPLLRRFFRELHASVGKEKLVAETVCGAIASFLAEHGARYKCCATVKPGRGSFSTVMEAWVLFRYYVKDDHQAEDELLRFGNIGDRSGSGALHSVALMRALQDISHDPKRTIRTPIVSKRIYALWVTSQASVDSIRQEVPYELLGRTLRDRLGLTHHKSRAQYVEITFPNHSAARRPTALDGGMHPAYRSVPDPKKKWGAAIDLSSGKPGLPEAVLPPRAEVRSIRIRMAGTLCEHDIHDLPVPIAYSVKDLAQYSKLLQSVMQ